MPETAAPDFGQRLEAAFAEHGRLCVGIDPHEALLRDWGLAASAAGVREFGLRAVQAATGRVGIVKPQVSFFERWGSAGFAALEEVISAARSAGLLVIADAKRGDIGSTMEAYASAWLAAGSPLEADAVTLSPYLGPEALRGTIALAARGGKGVFVLAATSNPEAAVLQSAECTDVQSVHGQSVADRVAHGIAWANGPALAAGRAFGPAGLVVGATVDRAAVGLTDEALEGAPLLAPGFGAQGAELSEMSTLFGRHAPRVIASASRSILGAGPSGLVAAIEAHRAELGEHRG